MSNIAKLKKKAAELEQKKQFDKALAVYIQILDGSDGTVEEADVALYNRVGDLLLRQGSVGEAVNYYEKAVDLYADGGFFNNAIALCNKILRNSPGRSSIYYKLGKISAKKGFVSDAKQNFLEYADRMQKSGQMDEAFRALKEFADLCPDQDDIRLMLAEQLSKKERKAEALEQLQILYDRLEAEGRSTEARATIDRMKAIDPTAEPKATEARRPQKSRDLVFLDVSYDEPPKKPAARGGPPAPKSPPPRPAPELTADLPLIDTGPGPDANARTPDAGSRPAGIDHGAAGSADFSGGAGAFPPADMDFGSSLDSSPLQGLEHSSFGVDGTGGAGPELLDIQPTSFGGDFIGGSGFESIADEERMAPEHDLALPGELPILELPGEISPDDSFAAGGALDLIMPGNPDARAGHGEGVLDGLAPPIARDDSAEVPTFGAGGAGLGVEQDDIDFFLTIDQGAESLTRDQPPEDTEAPRDAIESLTGYLSESGAVAELDTEDLDSHLASLPSAPPAAPDLDSVAGLRAALKRNPGDASLHRRLGESLLEQGSREDGLKELEHAMIAFERAGDLDSAESVADEVIRINPNSVRHHQKRVEYAFRTNDKPRLGDAYLELADSLFRTGQPEKAKAVYQRVLELAPDDIRAQAALSAFAEDEAVAEQSAPPLAAPPKKQDKKDQSGVFRRYTAERKRTEAAPEAAPPAAKRAAPNDDFVNLGDWLRDDQGPKSTRMVVEEHAPTGDEAADFADMLRRFKQGVAQNVDDEDHESHYDLGVAYKEMGLVEEAIAEFQKALRGTGRRVRTYEALGQCFLERSQFQVAVSVLERALADGAHTDEQLVGVLYLLGYASEGLQRWDDALGYYQRVFAVDIEFRDVSDRITALERVLQ